MLQGSFFRILSSQWIGAEEPAGPRTLTFRVALDPDHVIYTGHFPGNPVVPGVCQIQMIREGLESSLGTNLRLTAADPIKFLHLIRPAEHPELTVECKIRQRETSDIECSAVISDEETIFLKFRGTLCTKPA